MIRRLLLSRQKPLQLAIAWLGSFFGFFILLFSLQYYLDFRELLLVKNDWLHPEYLVVNKKVSLINAISGPRTFKEEDIKELEALPQVEKTGVFQSNLFKASGTIQHAAANGMNLYAELFFEALPDAFLDVKSSDWKWKEGDGEVPIIVPADYLKLYNFGFAPGQKLPQISEGMVSAVSFNIRIDGRDGRVETRGRIVGFSQRINSILVPLSFMEYANRNYAPEGARSLVSRVVLEVKDPSDPALTRLLEEKGYETNAEQLRSARLNNVLRVILGLVSVVGWVIVFLSILGFVQYSQLALQRSSYEIKTLIEIGHAPRRLFLFYTRYSVVLLFSIALLSLAGLYLLKWKADAVMAEYGFELASGLRTEIVPAALLIFALFLVFQLITLFRGIRKLA